MGRGRGAIKRARRADVRANAAMDAPRALAEARGHVDVPDRARRYGIYRRYDLDRDTCVATDTFLFCAPPRVTADEVRAAFTRADARAVDEDRSDPAPLDADDLDRLSLAVVAVFVDTPPALVGVALAALQESRICEYTQAVAVEVFYSEAYDADWWADSAPVLECAIHPVECLRLRVPASRLLARAPGVLAAVRVHGHGGAVVVDAMPPGVGLDVFESAGGLSSLQVRGAPADFVARQLTPRARHAVAHMLCVTAEMCAALLLRAPEDVVVPRVLEVLVVAEDGACASVYDSIRWLESQVGGDAALRRLLRRFPSLEPRRPAVEWRLDI